MKKYANKILLAYLAISLILGILSVVAMNGMIAGTMITPS